MSDAGAIAFTLALTGLVLAGAGVLFLWMARCSATGLLKRNQLAGVRTPLTLGSDDAWYPAQIAVEALAGVGATRER